LNALEKSGKASNTIVIYLGDHGEDMLRGKRTCYEGGLRVPMLMRWPGTIETQVRREHVSTLDLMPTLLSAAGATTRDGLPGRALQPLFQPGQTDWRTHSFAEYHTHGGMLNYFPQRAVRTDRYKLIENLLPGEVHPDYDTTFSKLAKEAKRREISGGLNLHAFIAQSQPEVTEAYARMRQPPRYELYDLQMDPYEFHNLTEMPEHQEQLKELISSLQSWREETRDPLLNPEALRRLTEEVRSIGKKAEGKDSVWCYPEYFFHGR
jgi:N-sulfoglucosamine sulfohydrolase